MNTAGQISPAYFVYKLFWQALDWVFPPVCGGCARPGERWCVDCQEQVAKINYPICPLCGNHQPSGLLCYSCSKDRPTYQALRTFAEYRTPLRSAILRLKFNKDIGLGEALSKHLIELYNLEKWIIDVVAPVPMSPKRFLERGYNQAGLLARPLAYAIRKQYRPEILQKNRETRTQVGLSAVERKRNVENAFICKPTLVQNKAILLVDDVTTTGSTISACAKALHDAGASAVYGLTLCRAVLQADADDLPKPSHRNGGKNGS